MLENGSNKVLFDPFFHSHFDTYTLVPEEIRQKIFQREKPFDGIKAIFISHSHGDHFSASDTFSYLQENPKVSLIAPQQAVDALLALDGAAQLKNPIFAINLEFEQAAEALELDGIQVEAVRIPHAGWPQRSEVENMVYRLSFDDKTVVMHMGDADSDRKHYQAHQQHWDKKQTDLAFPPYWFYFSKQGNDILENIIKVKRSVGIHVPTVVPENLKQTGKDYFSIPGEKRIINMKQLEATPVN